MQIKKVLVANRGEIAIRIMRACVEINIKTVGIYTYEDRYSLHRYKADESYQIGQNYEPLKPYLDIDAIVNLALEKGADAIHPGYGFLSENAELARKAQAKGIIFIGPDPEIMDQLGDKIMAKKVALACNVPIIQSNKKKLKTLDIAHLEAEKIGYPIMLKAASGGGGRGMRILRNKKDLDNAYDSAKREALNAFGDDTVFLEKYVEDPKHIEIQIVGDRHGNIVHLFERDCSIQRRFQKVVEVAPSLNLAEEVRNSLYKYAVAISKKVKYNNVGTVEFLVDKKSNIYFIEVNPRIQVEHTVTEMVTGIDLIKTQIFIAGGYKLSDKQIKITSQESVKVNGFAIQCRITTEDPANDFKPDYGTISTYRSAAGFGIRLDAGSLYQGSTVSPFFDSMLVKVSAQSRTLDGACRKMDRALKEFRIRGVKTNIPFLLNIINHPSLKKGKASVNFIQNHPALFKLKSQLDRGTKAVKFLGDIIVNGHPDVHRVDNNKVWKEPIIPDYDKYADYPMGTKDLLTKLGPEGLCDWLNKEKKIHYTDTTLRDAHQSLLATRIRTVDMTAAAEAYAKNHPQTFSLEVWGGATFDVCMRFLYEDPWKRLAKLRNRIPNILLQMLIRGSNAVGYKAYPDNLIEKFIEQAWVTGVDIFRIFDSLNWVKAMEPSIHCVRKRTGGIAEASICYTGDILNPKKTKYNLKYYIQLAKDLENAGAHMLAIKDMAGLLKPYAASELVKALKSEVKLPIHLHTHDTSGLQVATYLKAAEAGVDVIDVALGGLSGMTSQPNFNSVVEMMKFQKRENKFDTHSLQQFSNYWEDVRAFYYSFETGLKTGTAEVYKHEIPGGQYSNLRPQAIGLGLGDKFEEIKKMYSVVNMMFGDLVKVTPSSKVVGDMALFMVSNGYDAVDIMERGHEISFPESVQSFFLGELGQPLGGFPKKLQKIILKDRKPYKTRPNKKMKPVDFDKELKAFKKKYQKGSNLNLDINHFLSWKLYPKVWENAYKVHAQYDNIGRLPTRNFFYGMQPLEETVFEIAPGKTLIVKLLSIGTPNADGYRTVFFQVNGQSRNVQIQDKSLAIERKENIKIDGDNKDQVGAPLQGLLSEVLVKKGQKVKQNEPLFLIEAMKMETTVTAPRAGTIDNIYLKSGEMVLGDDLILSIK